MIPRTLTLALLSLLLGCQTLGPAILNTASSLAGRAAEWAVVKYPQKRTQFAAAEQALTLWLETGTAGGQPLDVTKLTTLLSTLGLDKAGWGDQGQLYLDGGLLIWNLVAPANYMVTSQAAVQQIGTSIRDGFSRGLAKLTVQPTTRSFSPPKPVAPPNRPGPIINI